MDFQWKSNKEVSPYFTNGTTQLYHIVEAILQQSGRADLFIATYTISEEFIRRLQKLKSAGLIQHLQMLIDARNSGKAMQLSYFLSHVADRIYLANNHSKLILIKNEKFSITVVTSQNQTRGNRFENGIIVTLPEVYEYFDKELKLNLEKSIEIDGILNRTIG